MPRPAFLPGLLRHKALRRIRSPVCRSDTFDFVLELTVFARSPRR
jgi:hypothetical protein